MHAWVHLLHSVTDKVGILLVAYVGARYYSETWKKKIAKIRHYNILSFSLCFIRGFLLNVKN